MKNGITLRLPGSLLRLPADPAARRSGSGQTRVYKGVAAASMRQDIRNVPLAAATPFFFPKRASVAERSGEQSELEQSKRHPRLDL